MPHPARRDQYVGLRLDAAELPKKCEEERPPQQQRTMLRLEVVAGLAQQRPRRQSQHPRCVATQARRRDADQSRRATHDPRHELTVAAQAVRRRQDFSDVGVGSIGGIRALGWADRFTLLSSPRPHEVCVHLRRQLQGQHLPSAQGEAPKQHLSASGSKPCQRRVVR